MCFGPIRASPKTRKKYANLLLLSAYDSVVIEKLKLKGKALDVKAVEIKKKKKKQHKSGSMLLTGDNEDEGKGASYDDYLTPSERRFLQQTEKVELQRLAKMATMSHRDRILKFNQYLPNLSHHYDIPKVGPVLIFMLKMSLIQEKYSSSLLECISVLS
ncbi:hypothetical protein Lal_00004948 [Lupinus albus]|nr:hypothetical protein Lal_00004948 [Lupinus albus]